MKTIGFFGDSFCSDLKSDEFETYIEKIVKENNLKLYCLGKSGSSIWDVILMQFFPLFDRNKLPDIIVFVWTNETRLFHRKIRNINVTSIAAHTEKKNEIWQAADQYYKNFLDTELSQFQYVSALKYFDLEILPKLGTDKKIIHLRSFKNQWLKKYNFNWQHGLEIITPLELLTCKEKLYSANHIHSNEKNQILFECISSAINDYDIKTTMEFKLPSS
jgi:hypothetical protein